MTEIVRGNSSAVWISFPLLKGNYPKSEGILRQCRDFPAIERKWLLCVRLDP